MSFKWITIAVVALMAMPAVANAHGTGGEAPNAAKFCKQMRAQQGEQHGQKLGKCVPVTRFIMQRLLKQAISECKADREATQAGLPEGERGEHKGAGNGERGDDKGERGEHNGESNREAGSAFRACVKEKMRALLADLRTKF